MEHRALPPFSKEATLGRAEELLPNYRAAIAAILKSGVGTAEQIGGLLAFNLIAFAVAEIPLVSFAIAPDATRARLDQLNEWIGIHQRLVITTVAVIVGVYLILVGESLLSSAVRLGQQRLVKE